MSRMWCGIAALFARSSLVDACTKTVSLSSGEFGYDSGDDYIYIAPMMEHTFDLSALDPEALHLSVAGVRGDFARYRRAALGLPPVLAASACRPCFRVASTSMCLLCCI
jgi:hypothetical protein